MAQTSPDSFKRVSTVFLHYGRLPSPRLAYARIALRGVPLLGSRRRGPLHADLIPRIEAACASVAIDRAHLAAYRSLCGYAHDDGAALPTLYPQLVAAPLHLEVLTHASFPLPPMGIVHMHNRVVEHSAILPTDRVALACAVVGARDTHRGIEFDIHTAARVGPELRWESTLTALCRTGGASKETRREEKPADAFPRPTEGAGTRHLPRAEWSVAEDTGRRYARVAGDWNPIHQNALLAKPFGFPRAIVHGTWSLARCLAALEGERALPSLPRVTTARFRKPVLLPSRVRFDAGVRESDGAAVFSLRTHDDRASHLEGSVERALPAH